jgi:alkyl hydroperoxide reductase subunit AhpC
MEYVEYSVEQDTGIDYALIEDVWHHVNKEFEVESPVKQGDMPTLDCRMLGKLGAFVENGKVVRTLICCNLPITRNKPEVSNHED